MSIPKLPSYNITECVSQILTPEVNKVEWGVNPEKAVLLIHDMQQYFIDFYGQESELVNQLVNNITKLKTLCQQQGIPVVYTAQPEDQNPEDRALLTDFWGPGLRSDSRTAHIISALAPKEADICFTKWRYSAFQRTPLHDFMREKKRDQLIICGVYAHIGILSTSLEAFMTDVKPFVVADAVADFSEADHQWALNYVATRCGKVETLASIEKFLLGKNDQHVISLHDMKRDIAKILSLDVNDIEDDEDLMDLGMDSIRMMELIEIWRKKGANVNFTDLASTSVLSDWSKVIGASYKNSAQAA